ncbi:MAG TPA: DUF190 domain-containing protein [Acidobacteriaceae bacterium]|nr:DUF190 domain-containing protein [Acidobacteriaceae bacterium]
MKTEWNAQVLQIFFGEQDKWQNKPLHQAVTEKCIEAGIAGATVFRGIEGFGASSTIHRSSLWSFSQDAPMMMTIVDRPEKIEQLLPELRRMVCEGVIVSSFARASQYVRNDPLVANR